jgi:SMI1 / KNR4 family (SUKH-1)
MPEPEQLSTEQLELLEGLLDEQGAPVVQRLQPPASTEALAAIESYLEISLPQEVRQWWGWHDGTDVEPGELAIQSSLGPLFLFRSAREALSITRECREDAEKVVPDDPDRSWGATWLALGNYGQVACDCAVDLGAPTPILDVDYHKAAYPGAPAARSFGEMVRWWIEALESGAWVYDPKRNRWERHEELVPTEREQVGLV